MNLYNINIEYEYFDEGYDLGEGYIVFKTKEITYLKEFYKDYSNTPTSRYLSILDDLEHCDSNYIETSSDSGIVAICALIESDEEFTVTFKYPHIIWLFHDLAHVMYDADYESITVFDYSERIAILKSIELLEENNIPIPIDILKETVQQFKSRFKTELKIDPEYHLWTCPSNLTLNAL